VPTAAHHPVSGTTAEEGLRLTLASLRLARTATTLRGNAAACTMAIVAVQHFLTRIASLAWLLAACGDAITTVNKNNNTLCILPVGGAMTMYALGRVCGCSRVTSAACTAAVADERVVVSSRIVIVTDRDAEECPTECYTRPVLCEGELPTEGGYAIVQGLAQAAVTFPLVRPLQRFGSLPSSDCEDLAEANGWFEQDAGPREGPQ